MLRVDLVGDATQRGRAQGELLSAELVQLIDVGIPRWFESMILDLDLSGLPDWLAALIKAAGVEHAVPALNRALDWVYEQEVSMIPQRLVDEMEANKEGADGGDPDVALGAADALEGVVDAMAPETALAALATRLGDGGAATVRCLCGVARRIDAEALTRGTPALVPGLVRAFNSQSADVRKAVVFCLVDMYMVLGEQLTPHLAVLSTSQLKLVTIYINRTAKARADRGGSSPPSASAFAPAVAS